MIKEVNLLMNRENREGREGMGGSTEYQVGALETLVTSGELPQADERIFEHVDDLREHILIAQGE